MLITHLRAKVELQRQPHLADRPVVIVDRFRGMPLVTDHFPACLRVTAGMALEKALSRNAGTVVLEADEPSYQRTFGRVLTDLQGVSVRVESAGLGTAYVRLDGLERLYGGEDGTLHALLHALPAYLGPRIGAGDAKFPAFAAALTCDAQGVARVPPDAAAFLAPHSVDLLPVDPDVCGRMHRFGLHTMGDVAAMRPEPLIDQFGVAGRRAWELSHGIDHDPMVPLPYEEAIVEHATLPFASASAEWAAGGRGHPAQAGLRPPPDAGPVRRQGNAGVRPGEGLPVGAAGQLQATGGRLGASRRSRAPPTGAQSPHCSRGGGCPHALRHHRRGGDADRALS